MTEEIKNGNNQAEETQAQAGPAQADAPRPIVADPQAMPTEQERKLSVIPFDPVRGGLVPQDFVGLYRVAAMLAGSGMVPKDMMNNAPMVATAIQFGAEVGLGIMASVQNISVINGRPSVWGDAPLGICEACGELAEFSEIEFGTFPSDEYGWTCAAKRVKRSGQVRERSGSFTVADARVAEVWVRDKKDADYKIKATPWWRWPKRMLQLRARSFVLRDLFPDKLKGISIGEDMSDAIDMRPGAAGVYGVGDSSDLAEKTRARIHNAMDARVYTAGPPAGDQSQGPAILPTQAPAPAPEATAGGVTNPLDLPVDHDWSTWASDWRDSRVGILKRRSGFHFYVLQTLPWFVCCAIHARRGNVSAETAINLATQKWAKFYGTEFPTPPWHPEVQRILDKQPPADVVRQVATQIAKEQAVISAPAEVEAPQRDIAFQATGKHDRFQVKFDLTEATVVQVDGEPVGFKIESPRILKLMAIPKAGKTVRIAVLEGYTPPEEQTEPVTTEIQNVGPASIEQEEANLKAKFTGMVDSYYPGKVDELTRYLMEVWAKDKDLEPLVAYEAALENFGGFIQSYGKHKHGVPTPPAAQQQLPAAGSFSPSYVVAQLGAYKAKDPDLYAAATKAMNFGNQMPPTDAGRLALFKKIEELRTRG